MAHIECELCGEHPATIVCNDCVLKCCPDCDEELHKSSNNASHARVPLKQSPSKTMPARDSNVSFEQSAHFADCDLCGEPAPVLFQQINLQQFLNIWTTVLAQSVKRFSTPSKHLRDSPFAFWKLLSLSVQVHSFPQVQGHHR